MGENSLVETGERSLGGGLEYAVDDSVCNLNFIDGTDCFGAKLAIESALRRWAEGHGVLTFTDVTGLVEPAFPLAVLRQAGQGAEIDFFGSTPLEFPPFQTANTHAYTIFYTRPPDAPLPLTNHGFSFDNDGRIESADVRFNAVRCYYIDIEIERPECVHFPTLVLHEIAHVLGIGHPDGQEIWNLDTDSDPTNEIPIDCRDPLSGLKHSSAIDGKAVAVGRDVQGPGRWKRGLTWDDVAARDALYPHCGTRRIDRTAQVWGAYARSSAGSDGRALLHGSETEAIRAALLDCGASDCELVEAFDGCFAIASDPNGVSAFAVSPSSQTARMTATRTCGAESLDCRITVDFCAFE